jgi:uncharacterized repeat protein (TIGR01451 family)
MKKLITVFALSLALFAFKPQAVSASCTPIYGGGESCSSYSFSIQKFVEKPGKGGGGYVNNLSINDPKYSPSQNVNFQIVITNTGTETIPTLNIVDTFPQYLNFVSGHGDYDKDTKKMSFTISNFEVGKSISYTLVGKIADTNSLPNDQGVICPINYVQATDSNGLMSSASSQFCVQKQVLAATVLQVLPVTPIKTTPATGPEMLPLALLFPGALWGLTLRKKSSRMSNTLKGGNK